MGLSAGPGRLRRLCDFLVCPFLWHSGHPSKDYGSVVAARQCRGIDGGAFQSGSSRGSETFLDAPHYGIFAT